MQTVVPSMLPLLFIFSRNNPFFFHLFLPWEYFVLIIDLCEFYSQFVFNELTLSMFYVNTYLLWYGRQCLLTRILFSWFLVPQFSSYHSVLTCSIDSRFPSIVMFTFSVNGFVHMSCRTWYSHFPAAAACSHSVAIAVFMCSNNNRVHFVFSQEQKFYQ